MSRKILHVRIFEQDELAALKEAIHRNLQVADNVCQNTCICCTRCGEEGTHYSPEGLTEYSRTGICERCWDVLVDEKQTEDNPRFDKLTPRGVAVVRLNLIVQRVISHLSMPVRPSSICDQIINDTFDFSALYTKNSQHPNPKQHQ